jgi:uncharacterized membrane protein
MQLCVETPIFHRKTALLKMQKTLRSLSTFDPRLILRGEEGSRLNGLTDAVFGIAITLLIFTQDNPNSFSALLSFTATLPAFLLSIAFLVLIWREHVAFSQVYGLAGGPIITLNTLFLTLIIFYVYPLRFLMLFLTGFFFDLNGKIVIEYVRVPWLIIYFGLAVAALYTVLFFYYVTAYRKRDALNLSPFETFYTRWNMYRLALMIAVPVASVVVVLLLLQISIVLASIGGGMVYWLYSLGIWLWNRSYNKAAEKYPMPVSQV